MPAFNDWNAPSDSTSQFEAQFDPGFYFLEQVFTDEPSGTARNKRRDSLSPQSEGTSPSRLHDAKTNESGDAFSSVTSPKETKKCESTPGSDRSGEGRMRQRRRRKTGPLSPDQTKKRREEYLERNRIAANKCRRKKSLEIASLQEKEIALQKVNEGIKAEWAQIKDEVAKLRVLVMMHVTGTFPSLGASISPLE